MKNKPDIREKVLINGLSFPTNTELIMLLLGSGIKGVPVTILAKRVMDTINGCRPEELIDELIKIDGIGITKAVTIGAAIEFGRRQNIHRGKKILKPADAVPFVQHYSIQSQEHFVCITLNGANEIIKMHPVALGTVNRLMIHPREVFANAFKDMAASIVVCHNHPSGNCNPSEDDLETTSRLVEASKCLGIRLLDHIIVSQEGYFSFLENDLLSLME
ncbi:MAG: DNA repair protein RadC [Spirochaetaceae bacterium]|nr:DNA repair protein RadC [Spirochaetaceae bacterium]